jgi:putative aldouronate transport system substrate-binding protein
MTVSFVACGSKGKEDSQETASTEVKDETSGSTNADTTEGQTDENSREAIGAAMKDTTINIRLMNEFTNMDKVVAKYEELVADDPILSKIHLNFSFVTGADYKDKLSMALSAEEDYDLMFCGSWHGLSTYISQGCFADLTSYFNNDAFPGLKAGFSEGIVNAASTFVKDDNGEWKQKNFVIPLAEYYEDIRGVYYREDLRQKYGCAEIKDDASLKAYLDTVMKLEPNMIGWSMYNGFFNACSDYYSAKHDNVIANDATTPMGEETPFYLGLSEDGKTVLNAVVMGDDESQFAKMPEGYQNDFIKEYEIERTKWAPYLDPNRGTTDETMADAIVTYGTLSNWANENKTLKEKYPDAQWGFYVTEEAQRNMEKGAIVSDMKTNNQLVVPAWSEKVDAVMYFLDWMFASKENHDLFQYGIEGEDWEAVGEDGYRLLDVSEDKKYTVPTYSFCLNTNYVRINEAVKENPTILAYYNYMLSPDTYTQSPLSGFNFNTTSIQSEIANVSALSSELMTRFALYGDDTAAKIDEWHKNAADVGLDTIRAELVKQAQEFLDMKNSLK